MEESRMRNMFRKVNELRLGKVTAIKTAVSNNRGEGYIDTAVKILIAVVLGALLLAGLYMLFGDVVMPTLNERIQEMFNYAG
jgi:Na+-driven multidrug efflux pump